MNDLPGNSSPGDRSQKIGLTSRNLWWTYFIPDSSQGSRFEPRYFSLWQMSTFFFPGQITLTTFQLFALIPRKFQRSQKHTERPSKRELLSFPLHYKVDWVNEWPGVCCWVQDQRNMDSQRNCSSIDFNLVHHFKNDVSHPIRRPLVAWKYTKAFERPLSMFQVQESW